MIQDVKALQPNVQVEPLVDRKGPVYVRVNVIEIGTAQGVSSEVAEGACSLNGKCCLIDKETITRCTLSDLLAGVDPLWIDQVRTVETLAVEGNVRASSYVDGRATEDADQRCKLPAIDQCAGNPV